MKCKVCNNTSQKIFEKRILNKYDCNYYQCLSCSFVQTDTPFWLEEAYESAITSLDIGLLSRNTYLQKEVPKIIYCCFPEARKMVDYAGGYGVFVRLMRDSGYDFYRQDAFCENIFAKNFDVTDIPDKKFDIATAFEVFEHFSNPLEDIAKIFDYADHLILTTELIPDETSEIENWWYIAEETGQHISFYSTKAMEIIGEKFNKNYYQKNRTTHIFTSKELSQDQINCNLKEYTIKKKYFGLKTKIIEKDINIEKESLLESDYQFIKNNLK